jgi:hypothetical protein
MAPALGLPQATKDAIFKDAVKVNTLHMHVDKEHSKIRFSR